MSDTGQTAAKGSANAGAPRKGGRSLLMLGAIALLLVIIAGGGAYFYLGRARADHSQLAKAEAPLPFYLKVKPFVVSLNNGSGIPHFVQLGVTLSLSGPALGHLIEAVLPEVEDAMRQTLLAFKVEDITTPAGVDKLRKAMIANVNHVLLLQPGAARIKEANAGRAEAVRNIYFTTLTIE
ncbi:MAG: flagellar basal body-associated FliL family protein [Stellaceae bacterium]